MKPIQLSISAWGPYKDLVEIDFERASAQGIFLITALRRRQDNCILRR